MLDNIIKITQQNYNPFATHNTSISKYNDIISLPHHIHGELTKDLILGVDNKEQILNEKLKNDTRLTNYIIKSVLNDSLGEMKIEIAKSIIDKSKYVCLFGLSIGDTDKMWWAYIIKWLIKDSDNRLVFFCE